MLFSNVFIESLTHELPTKKVTTRYITEQIGETLDRVGIPRDMIMDLTGITERCYWEESPVKPSVIASRVGQKAIDQAGVTNADIDLIINASIWRDHTEPSTASLVHGNLGLSRECMNFDVSNACLGFVNGIATASQMIEAGLVKHALVVSAETMEDAVFPTIELLKKPETSKTLFKNNFATLTLGSGAVAMVLSHRSVTRTAHQVNGVIFRAGTEYNRLCIGDPPYMNTDASALLRASMDVGRSAWQAASAELSRWEDPGSLYIPHQVGMRHVMGVNKAMGNLPMEKVYVIFPNYGNMGSAAIPVAFSMAVDEGKITSGQHVGLIGFGSGLNSGFMSIDW